MPSSKRPGDNDVEGSAKKKKIAGASRTGQACDRCKVRKIRCDARPGGCSPCLQNNTECRTTDRITGRANSRGHTESIENENASLKMYMVELQQQLRENGLEPRAAPTVPPSYQGYWSPTEQQQGSWGDLSAGNGMMPASNQSGRNGSQGSLLPDFRPGCIGDNYLGVSSGNDWGLSPIEGTSLALFGMKIDLAEFLPAETDPASSPMSYQTFLSYAFGKRRAEKPPLPEYEACKTYSEWFFKSVQIFTPILHKPDYMKLLLRVYNGYQPNAAETVIIHMVLAIMTYQYSSRNGNEQARVESISHYHYAITFVPQLFQGHTLQDVQALTLICSQLRSQPRPGAVWMFTNMVFGLAVELGLHRSANAWQGSPAERDPHTEEMRKRVFWSIIVLHVYTSGKLGRPMPIRPEDMDIEFPESIPDNIPGEPNVSKWRKCSFRVANTGFKLNKILMEVYSAVYAIRPSGEPYDVVVQNIEKQLQKFRVQLPAELSGGSQTVEEDQSPALYLQISQQEIRLLLHHPSLCRTMSPHIMTTSLDICLDASKKMLAAAVQIKALKCLDTTWYSATIYLAAIFTSLFVYTHRQEQMSSAELQRVRQDMDTWLEVIGEVGNMLGTGPRLREAVRSIIDFSLGNIGRHLAAKTASAGLAAGSPSTEQPQNFPNTNGYANSYVNGNASTDQPYQNDHTQQEQHPYSNANHFYPEPQNASMQPYSSGSMAPFDTAAYSTEDMKPSMQAHLNAQQSPSSFMAAFQSPNAQNGFHAVNLQQQQQQQHHQHQQSGHAVHTAWRTFTDNMMTNLGGQDYMNSASALMALGADKSAGLDLAAMQMAASDGVSQQQPWPLLQYNTGQNGEGQ